MREGKERYQNDTDIKQLIREIDVEIATFKIGYLG